MPPDLLRLGRFILPLVRALHGEPATGLAFFGEADPPCPGIYHRCRGGCPQPQILDEYLRVRTRAPTPQV